MFTGLVRECGWLKEPPRSSGQGGTRLCLGLSAELAGELSLGASLAVSGVCLTVTELGAQHVVVELAPETLRRTNLSQLQEGSRVNLEPALRLGDALGGHWMQGHVDNTVTLIGRRDHSEHRELTFTLPASNTPYVVEKGSVALDGVSLTVASVAPGRFGVALIPHTLEVTSLGELAPGQQVNFEADILAKYVERAVAAWKVAVP